MDARGKRRPGRGFAGTRLEVDAELTEDILRVGEHVHEMGNRGALVAADIADAGLEEGLGDRKDAFAAELLARADPQLLDLFGEGAFGHFRSFRRRRG